MSVKPKEKRIHSKSDITDTHSILSYGSNSTKRSSNNSSKCHKKQFSNVQNKKQKDSTIIENETIDENENYHIEFFSQTLSDKRKINQIRRILSMPEIDINNLKLKCCTGIPQQFSIFHAVIWKYLTEIYPCDKFNASKIIKNRRLKYLKNREFYENSIKKINQLTQKNQDVYEQILKDVPRTMPNYPFFKTNIIQKMLIRILYIWSLNNPDYSYVQGLNDLCVPFVIIYFNEYCNKLSIEQLLLLTDEKINAFPEKCLKEVEADIYSSFSFLLNKLKNNYINEQPAIKLMMKKLNNLIKISDYEMYSHLNNNNLNNYNESTFEYAFEWFYCYFTRELNIKTLVYLWDCYLCGENTWNNLHIYVCKNILFDFKKEILNIKDYYDTIVYLQNLPLKYYDIDKIKKILDKSYKDKILYDDIINTIV